MPKTTVVTTTELPLPLFIRGKVRDTYDLGKFLLIVATDRISAFDVVLSVGIPDKGKVLNQLSAFWFEKTRAIVPNHMEKSVDDLSSVLGYVTKKDIKFPDYLKHRSMVVHKLERINVECVARGYLSGSGWAEYQKSGTVNGIRLPKDLQESQKLPEPIFTPTTKADAGHDMPLTMAETEKLLGKDLAAQLKEKTLAVYTFARDYALAKGIIIADTKVEFGLDKGKLVLIDELLTPDSSRFWEASQYQVGRSQPSYDKQPVRDWLVETGWNKEPPAPDLPPEVVDATSRRYRQAYEKLTGKKLVD
jgi:phosphoribosylaminoimidazole-succinocarboxamide synthase